MAPPELKNSNLKPIFKKVHLNPYLSIIDPNPHLTHVLEAPGSSEKDSGNRIWKYWKEKFWDLTEKGSKWPQND